MLWYSTPYPYFEFEQAVMLGISVERVQQQKVLAFEKLQLGITLEELVVEPRIHERTQAHVVVIGTLH